jgi:hypothetical protein
MDGARRGGAALENPMSSLPSFAPALALGVCSLVLALGCSGAETQDVLSSQAGATSSSGGSSGGSSSGGSSGASSSSGGSSGTTSSSSGGTASDCATPEQEPNDNRNAANTLAPERCGTVSARSDQRDFLTFRLKATTKEMFFSFKGNVRLKVDAGNENVELTPENAATTRVPFVRNVDYVIEVSPLTDGASDVPWKIEIIEK